MAMLSFIGSDIFLPAMPAMAKSLAINADDVEKVMTAYLSGMTIILLFYGMISDRFGRRRPFLISLTLGFIGGGLMAALSKNYSTLLIGLFLQGAGGAACMFTSQAMIADYFRNHEIGRNMALVFACVAISPIIAPFLGGLISEYYQWHWTFGFATAVAILTLFLALWKLPETLAVEKRQPLKPGATLQHYVTLLSSRPFWGYLIIPIGLGAFYFGYLTASPFIYKEAGFSNLQIGSIFTTSAVGYIVGNMIARRRLFHTSINRLILQGMVLNIIAVIVMISLTVFSVLWLAGGMILYSIGAGLISAQGTSGALSIHPHIIGYATALMGIFNTLGRSLSSAAVGSISHNTAPGLEHYMLALVLTMTILHIALIPPSPRNLGTITK